MPIYIVKKSDGTPVACGDMASVKYFTGGSFEMVVSEEDWDGKHRNCLHLDEAGQIVLGPSTEQNAQFVRTERNLRLVADCDSLSAMRLASMTETERTAWAEYRQALLDIPQTEGFPWDGVNVPWPTKPGE